MLYIIQLKYVYNLVNFCVVDNLCRSCLNNIHLTHYLYI
nr:MAG TPA: hypothetical protein [Caudoviricetes sp.]